MVDAFLFSCLEIVCCHASRMKGAQEAVDRILRAIEKKEKDSCLVIIYVMVLLLLP